MPTSPYEPPKSDLELSVEPTPQPAWITSLLATLVVLPGFVLLLTLPFAWSSILEDFQQNPLKVCLGAFTGLSSLAGGALLAGLRPLCIPFIALGFAAGLGSTLAFQSWPSPALVWSAFEFAALAYAVWLWRRGSFRSRPNNSSKPTPLRGAA